jgi:hypothetical protein
MKKIFALLIVTLMFMGCSGINSSTAVNATVDVAFVAALQNNPGHVPEVKAYLATVKEYISCTECSIEELKFKAVEAAPVKYQIYALILSDYIDDTAVLNWLDDKINAESRDKITKKIDRLIRIAGLICPDGTCNL